MCLLFNGINQRSTNGTKYRLEHFVRSPSVRHGSFSNLKHGIGYLLLGTFGCEEVDKLLT